MKQILQAAQSAGLAPSNTTEEFSTRSFHNTYKYTIV